MRSFEHWETEDLELIFGIQEVRNLSFLGDWINAQESVSATEKQVILQLQKRLRENVIYWQEDELKSFFILKQN
jgi:hypothetical protein